jgi:hypothetical protein
MRKHSTGMSIQKRDVSNRMGMLNNDPSYYQYDHRTNIRGANDEDGELNNIATPEEDRANFCFQKNVSISGVDFASERPSYIAADDSTASTIDSPHSSAEPSPSETAEQQSPASTEYVLNVAFYSFVLFMMVQAVFAYIAKSQAMIADCEAMSVDAITYLLNLCAERYKNRPYTPYELSVLSLPQRQHRRALSKCYFEFIPPTISVVTLILVTIFTLQDATTSLLTIATKHAAATNITTAMSGDDDDDDDDDTTVSIPIMFGFSFANLLLDIMNVTCFTRSGFLTLEWMKMPITAAQPVEQQLLYPDDVESSTETSLLLLNQKKDLKCYTNNCDNNDDDPNQSTAEVNLNMCSAWTVRWFF